MLGKDPSEFSFWGGQLPEREVSIDLPQTYFKNEVATREEWRALRSRPLRYFLYREMVKILRPGKIEHLPRLLFIGAEAIGMAMDAKKMFGRGVSVVALEETAIAADLARSAVRENGLWLDVVAGDLHELPFGDEEFDVVIANLSYGEDNFEVTRAEIHRVLVHQGEALLRVFDSDKIFPWHKNDLEKWREHGGFYSVHKYGVLFSGIGLGLDDARGGMFMYWVKRILRFVRARNVIVKMMK